MLTSSPIRMNMGTTANSWLDMVSLAACANRLSVTSRLPRIIHTPIDESSSRVIAISRPAMISTIISTRE